MTNNYKLPPEILIIIFDILVKGTHDEQKKILEQEEKDEELYRYYDKCEHCTSQIRATSARLWIQQKGFFRELEEADRMRQDYHYKRHKDIRIIKR